LRWWGKIKNRLSVEPKDYKHKLVFQLMTETHYFKTAVGSSAYYSVNFLYRFKQKNKKNKLL
jgi:hypothetical protein